MNTIWRAHGATGTAGDCCCTNPWKLPCKIGQTSTEKNPTTDLLNLRCWGQQRGKRETAERGRSESGRGHTGTRASEGAKLTHGGSHRPCPGEERPPQGCAGPRGAELSSRAGHLPCPETVRRRSRWGGQRSGDTRGPLPPHANGGS